MMARPFQIKSPARMGISTADLIFRLVEMVVCVPLVLFFLPLWLVQSFRGRIRGESWCRTEQVSGIGGKPVTRRLGRPLGGLLGLLLDRRWLRHSPQLWQVLRGNLSLVGPPALTEEEIARLTPEQQQRLSVKPGLVNSFFLRRSVNIAFEDEPELALQDVRKRGLARRLSMLLRALPASLLATERGRDVDILEMFGLRLRNETREAAVARIEAMVDNPQPQRIAFVNPGCVNIAMKDPTYRDILDRSDVVFPDGIGIKIACRYLGLNMRDNLNGTDLFPALCDHFQHGTHGFYFLGARPGVCEAMIENIQKTWPNLTISGYRHGYFSDEEEERGAIEAINQSGASLLFVAMGVPNQEKWIDRAMQHLEVPVTLGVGGLFDFVSGRIPRAPLWMREIGLEWLYRLIREPARLWRRYVIGNFVFLWHLMRYHT